MAVKNTVKNFWNRVNKNGPIHPVLKTRCWVWRYIKPNRPKITFWLNGRREFIYRHSWEIHHGPIPRGLCVCHKCDNPPCVNPDHLFVGTQLENIKDRDNKKRQAVGGKNARSKLTIGQVKHIKKTYVAGCRQNGGYALARKFGVQPLAVQCIIRGRTWRHVK